MVDPLDHNSQLAVADVGKLLDICCSLMRSSATQLQRTSRPMRDEPSPKKDIRVESTINVNSASGEVEIVGAKIGELHAREAHFHEAARPLLTPQERRNRQVMLDKVEQFWVKGVLDQSLYKVARIELGLENAPDAVMNPWESIIQRPEQPDRVISPGKPIVEVFDELQGSMLILGAPGAGKTTLLLELARDLIARARADEWHAIPVVLNLSSWAVERKPLKKWLVEELRLRYDVPPKVGEAWVDNDVLLPLLDGLDEVDTHYRDACVKAISTYRQEEAMVSLVVCSRVADYNALSGRLRIQGAVLVQPLDAYQVDVYLARLGDSVLGVRALWRENLVLHELLDTPLMLAVVVMTYKDRPAEELRQSGGVQELWDAYAERMFSRKGAQVQWAREQVLNRLKWLAWHMRKHQQTVYYIDGMQPVQLLGPLGKYLIVTVSVFGALVGALIGAGVAAFYIGTFEGIATGALFGLFSGGYLGYSEEIVINNTFRWSWVRIKKFILEIVVVAFLIWIAWVVFGRISTSLHSRFPGILVASRLEEDVFVGVFICLTLIIASILILGLSGQDIGIINTPNQGVIRSYRNAWSMSGLVIIPFAVILGTYETIILGFGPPRLTLATIMAAAPIAWALYGGRSVIQHYLLRFLLARQGHLPFRDRNLIALLDYAVDRILLRRVGGGWIFVHRMLLEHLADKYEAEHNIQPVGQSRQQ